MLGNENRPSKTLVALATIGLLLALWTPRASAQLTGTGPFTTMNFSGRYACLTFTNPFPDGDDGGEFNTAVIKYNPNGSGKYTAGTLIANEAFLNTTGTPNDSSHFCLYTLDTTKSTYVLTTHGVGSETLTWNGAAANDAVCPCSKTNLCGGNTFFTEQTAFAVRNQLNVNGFTTRADQSSINLFNFGASGNGYCVK
jgi:hypothetical protein